MKLIVARTEEQAERLRVVIGGIDTRVIWPSLREVSGCSVDTVIVLPGVDLSQDIGGEGQLGLLLQSRQRLFAKPVFEVLK